MLGLKATASTGEANSVLDVLRDISKEGATHEDLQRRISGIKRRSDEFTDGVMSVLSALDGSDDDCADADPSAAVRILSRRVNEAQEISTESKTITEEREKQEMLQDEAELAVEEAEKLIEEMVQVAGVDDESELLEAIDRSEKNVGLLDQINQVEDNLREATGKQLNRSRPKLANWPMSISSQRSSNSTLR